MRIQQWGGVAALLNPVAGLAMLAIAVALIGPAAGDPVRMAEMAIHQPLALILQDLLKLVSAGLSAVLILALANRLGRAHPRTIWAANGFGFLSVACLAANAGLSLFATSQAAVFAATSPEAGIQLSSTIGWVAMAVIFLNGMWYLLISWAGLRSGQLPRWLCIVGLAMGASSLVPPLAILVLVISLGWSVWLGRVLLTGDPAAGEG